jgi:hypothetical protein
VEEGVEELLGLCGVFVIVVDVIDAVFTNWRKDTLRFLERTVLQFGYNTLIGSRYFYILVRPTRAIATFDAFDRRHDCASGSGEPRLQSRCLGGYRGAMRGLHIYPLTAARGITPVTRIQALLFSPHNAISF